MECSPCIRLPPGQSLGKRSLLVQSRIEQKRGIVSDESATAEDLAECLVTGAALCCLLEANSELLLSECLETDTPRQS